MNEAVLLQAHHEEDRFFGKDNHAGKDGRQQAQRKTTYEVTDSIKEALGLGLRELEAR